MSSSAEPRDGFLFVRGVGTSARDASLEAAHALLFVYPALFAIVFYLGLVMR